MNLDALRWQQEKDVSDLYLAYYIGGPRTWKIIPWHGQKLDTFRVWYILNQ